MYFAMTVTHTAYQKAFKFCHVLSYGSGSCASSCWTAVFVPEPLVFCSVGALITLSVLLDQCASKGQEASPVFML